MQKQKKLQREARQEAPGQRSWLDVKNEKEGRSRKACWKTYRSKKKWFALVSDKNTAEHTWHLFSIEFSTFVPPQKNSV